MLRSHLHLDLYHHFMLMHVAVSILINPILCQSRCDYAETFAQIISQRKAAETFNVKRSTLKRQLREARSSPSGLKCQ